MDTKEKVNLLVKMILVFLVMITLSFSILYTMTSSFIQESYRKGYEDGIKQCQYGGFNINLSYSGELGDQQPQIYYYGNTQNKYRILPPNNSFHLSKYCKGKYCYYNRFNKFVV